MPPHGNRADIVGLLSHIYRLPWWVRLLVLSLVRLRVLLIRVVVGIKIWLTHDNIPFLRLLPHPVGSDADFHASRAQHPYRARRYEQLSFDKVFIRCFWSFYHSAHRIYTVDFCGTNTGCFEGIYKTIEVKNLHLCINFINIFGVLDKTLE